VNHENMNREVGEPHCAPDPLLGETDGESAMRILRAAAGAFHPVSVGEASARIPLEQLERELLRVMHIELAAILRRARDLVRRGSGNCDELSAARRIQDHEGRHLEAADRGESVLFALQCEARETIEIARACGARVPRVALRLLDGGPATWPSPARFEAWARRLDPDVELCSSESGTDEREVLSH
jgi:hypothetical protein